MCGDATPQGPSRGRWERLILTGVREIPNGCSAESRESRGESQRRIPSDMEPLATVGDVAGD